ncbi:MAG: plasmid stabilization protein [bacterium]|nr:MAG: plasmid stabilization protein [bacterium]
MYKYQIKKSAKKRLLQIPFEYQEKILQEIVNLTFNPFPPGCKKLKRIEGTPEYSIRVGQYRVVYEVHKDEILILVVKIGHRKDVYR